jgi:hypothetical protein
VTDTAGAIPDSVVVQIDATQESFTDGESVSTATDYSGNSNDLTGSATYKTNIQNSNGVFRTDGIDDVLDNFLITLNRPTTFILAAQANSGEYGTLFSTTSGGLDRAFVNRESSSDSIEYFSNTEGRIQPSSIDNTWQIISFLLLSDGSVLRRNSSTLGTASGAASSWDGLRLAQQYNIGNQVLAADFGELRVFDADLSSTGELANQEQALGDKWGISF